MLCVVIPTLNAGTTLPGLLGTLQSGVDRLVIADGGSTDDTLAISAKHGALFANGQKGRGHQLARGASWAGNCDWYLFIHADCRLPDNWRSIVSDHIAKYPDKCAYFRFGADAKGFRARAMEFWVGARCFWLKWPYGDQGLLISKAMYDSVGGYQDQALFEDVALINALKQTYRWRDIRPLPAKMMTDISLYREQGFWRRGSRNLGLLIKWVRGASHEELMEKYK